MNKFENERLCHVNLDTKIFKNPIPIIYAKPKALTDKANVFIFVGGLGSTNSFNIYMNNSLYDTNYFVTYDKMAHGDNKNKATQYKAKYLKELDCVVDWAKNEFGNRPIYLLGESWGCAINFLYQKKNWQKIAGVINWNMPTKPIDPEKKTFGQMFAIAWREFATFLFNVTCYLPPVQESHEKISRNPFLIRLRAMMPKTRSNTKLTLVVWRYMFPSYLFLKKNVNNPKYNFLYIQSGQDALADWKAIAKIEKNADNNHYLKLPTGYHILSMEPVEQHDLYKAIENFTNKKN